MARRPVARAQSVQEDLFAPSPPPRIPGDASPPDHYAGPVSQVTGGPLNGNEAIRVADRKSIAHAGGQYQDGTTVCKTHQEPWRGGHGFLRVVYCGTAQDVPIGPCVACGAPVVGEPP